MKLIGLDYLGISEFFSDEELLVQKSCREFVNSDVLPIIDEGKSPKSRPPWVSAKYIKSAFEKAAILQACAKSSSL